MSWSLQLVVLLASYHLITLPSQWVLLLFGTADFGPTDVAMVFIASQYRIPEIYTLLKQVKHRNINPVWYIFAFLLPIFLVLLSVLIAIILGAHPPTHWLQIPQNLGALILPSIGEEFGWRGFALPQLQRRYTALTSSLILGIIWAIWHLPISFLPDAPIRALPFFFVGVIASSIILTWLYNSTGKNLLLVIVAHIGLDFGLINVPLGTSVNLIHPMLAMLVYCVAAILILLINGSRTLCRVEMLTPVV